MSGFFFSKFRNGVVRKNNLQTPSITVSPVDPSTKATNVPNFQEMVNQAIHHVLINQSSILVNTLSHLIKQGIGGNPGQQLGPAYFHIGMSTLNTKGKEVPPEFAFSNFQSLMPH